MRIKKWLVALACLTVIGSIAGAQAASAAAMAKKAAPAKTSSKPAVTSAVARDSALARVPDGTLKSEKLEHMKGKLVYVVHVAQKGKTGYERVDVDAADGRVLSMAHTAAGAAHGSASKTGHVTTASTKPAPKH